MSDIHFASKLKTYHQCFCTIQKTLKPIINTFYLPFRDEILNANEIHFDFVSHIGYYYRRNRCIRQRFVGDCKENQGKTLGDAVKNLAQRLNWSVKKVAERFWWHPPPNFAKVRYVCFNGPVRIEKSVLIEDLADNRGLLVCVSVFDAC